MSVYLLPLQICDSIEKLMNRFWWSSGGERQNGIHWLSWSRLSIPKKCGGMGFKKIHEFNIALLAKQDAKLGGNPSYIWRSILAGQHVLKSGVARTIGDGVGSKIWGWPWLADPVDSNLHTACIEELKDATVSGLLDADDSQLVFTAWERLWKLPVPPKVRNLLWRCARNILPVRVALQSKRVWIGGGCPLCSHMEETAAHLFCECEVARHLWGEGDVLHGRALSEFMDTIISSPTADRAMLMAAIFWVLWSTRNEWKVQRLIENWKAVYCVSNASLISPMPTAWTCPTPGVLKCNIDATIFDNDAGYGAVVCDYLGLFVVAKCDQLGFVRDPLLAESLAIKEALTWIKDIGHHNIILESDCLNFCLSFNSRSIDFSYIGSIVKQCHSIARNIGNVSVRHVQRSANHVAHVLARATGSLCVWGSWDSFPPDCIASLLSF
ncbi:uncharacterized protein LOC116029785 [Ipomoea triloba]|uniref:uncharacterized protein LOC116029785 n=1 Tax=Ipomoea triloba TaxID=35885 RepID=UPI00125D76F1|nr:uncharacterized protein LOC116029785 [Ipomoea triloba]